MTAVRMASTAAAVHLALLPQDPSPAGHVFAGQQLLDEQSAELAGRIEAAFLAEAGWDAAAWVLTLPPDHPLLGRPVCRAPGCQTTCHEKTGICLDCRRLISRINGDIAQLPDAERAQVDEAVTVIRKHRAVSLGMPTVPTVPPSPAGKALA